MFAKKGGAILIALSIAGASQTITFDVWVVDTGGDFTFDATATHWEPGINQIRPDPILNLTTPGATAVVQPTKRIRWEDTVEMVNGRTATLTQWVSTNHTMNMVWDPVPEPATVIGLAIGVTALAARRRRR
ncbi:MAG: PEP-CTERM sorting domain-containing protein [Armatimonadetes bacterium]|nr:PEP-CTERM sorting domain-containing protein [Armatimonadota bacterium]